MIGKKKKETPNSLLAGGLTGLLQMMRQNPAKAF